MSAGGAGAAAFGLLSGGAFPALLAAALVMGGCANPLYPLILAYVNDAVETEDMAAASGGLLFVNGMGAILGPVALGALMGALGPPGFWAFCAALFAAVHALRRLSDEPPAGPRHGRGRDLHARVPSGLQGRRRGRMRVAGARRPSGGGAKLGGGLTG